MCNIRRAILSGDRSCYFFFFFFQTVKFKSYLLSMGIPDPVTRESHGTGDKYYTELARQLASVLENPIKVRIF